MNSRKINIVYKENGVVNNSDLHLINNVKCILQLNIPGKPQLTAEGDDFFDCFKTLRRLNNSITYFCKGAKINVLPSRMTRQMTMGLTAYETTLGVPALKDNLVNIFDYEDENLASDPLEQEQYEAKWFSSLNN